MADEIPKEPIPIESEAPQEPISDTEPLEIKPESEITPETQTAQIPVNEPLETEIEIKPEPTETQEVKSEEVSPVSEPVSTESSSEVKPEIKPESEIVSSSQQTEQVSQPTPPEEKPQAPEPTPQREVLSSVSIISQTKNKARELLIKARSAIQSRKRKKLDKVMAMFVKKNKITNDEVEKILHVSDATATRYLSQLEKEGKIKQNGKTGKWVYYSKI